MVVAAVVEEAEEEEEMAAAASVVGVVSGVAASAVVLALPLARRAFSRCSRRAFSCLNFSRPVCVNHIARVSASKSCEFQDAIA